jgi:homogentisate 1,2-dioxygenase
MPPTPPNVDLYTRNGFVGPGASLVRSQYAPSFTRVVGSYTPQRFSVLDVPDAAFADERGVPVPLITGEGISIETSRRRRDMPFAVRNVLADELHFVYSGVARLETDFGALDVVAGDFVLIPRAVTYRFRDVAEELVESILVTPSQLAVDPENAPGVLNVELHVDIPDPAGVRPVEIDGEYEVVLRHGIDSTSYYFDYDPLPTLHVGGAPIVRRFNIANVHGISVESGNLKPPKIIDDSSGRTMVYYVGSRRVDQPPIHHNADYDEIAFYVSGPGHWGAMSEPGTAVWVPKGVIHQGPAEDVAEGFRAFLIEVRAPLAFTPVGREIGDLTETNQFDLHDTVKAHA